MHVDRFNINVYKVQIDINFLLFVRISLLIRGAVVIGLARAVAGVRLES
jgi:hypothetical protein